MGTRDVGASREGRRASVREARDEAMLPPGSERPTLDRPSPSTGCEMGGRVRNSSGRPALRSFGSSRWSGYWTVSVPTIPAGLCPGTAQ